MDAVEHKNLPIDNQARLALRKAFQRGAATERASLLERAAELPSYGNKSDPNRLISWPEIEALLARDNCEVCHGEKGGVRGNENVIDGRRVCDYCHADGSYQREPVTAVTVDPSAEPPLEVAESGPDVAPEWREYARYVNQFHQTTHQGAATAATVHPSLPKRWEERYEAERSYYGQHDEKQYMAAEIAELRTLASELLKAGAAPAEANAAHPVRVKVGSLLIADNGDRAWFANIPDGEYDVCTKCDIAGAEGVDANLPGGSAARLQALAAGNITGEIKQFEYSLAADTIIAQERELECLRGVLAVRTVGASEELRNTIAPRALAHDLDAYWQAPSGRGPLAARYGNKPHQLVYELIAALLVKPESSTEPKLVAESGWPAVDEEHLQALTCAYEQGFGWGLSKRGDSDNPYVVAGGLSAAWALGHSAGERRAAKSSEAFNRVRAVLAVATLPALLARQHVGSGVLELRTVDLRELVSLDPSNN